jgi:RNase P protein component
MMTENSNFTPQSITPQFQAVYIIDANTGISLVSQDFSDQHFDEDLISGMFRALETFINHLAYSNEFEKIQEINFQGVRIIYERYGGDHPVLGVAISKKQDPIATERLLLKNILQDFYQTYQSQFNNFRGNVLPFQQFRNRLSMMNINKNFKISQTTQSPKFPAFSGFQSVE